MSERVWKIDFVKNGIRYHVLEVGTYVQALSNVIRDFGLDGIDTMRIVREDNEDVK